MWKKKNNVAYPIKRGVDENGKNCMLICFCLVDAKKPIDVKQLPKETVAIELSVCKTMFALYKKEAIENISIY